MTDWDEKIYVDKALVSAGQQISIEVRGMLPELAWDFVDFLLDSKRMRQGGCGNMGTSKILGSNPDPAHQML